MKMRANPDVKTIDMFQREKVLLSRLSHPHIVRFLGIVCPEEKEFDPLNKELAKEGHICKSTKFINLPFLILPS
jgi:hypothetical protein